MYVELEGPPGATDLVLLHGGIGTGRYHWSRLLPALAERYRVHLPDLPGHGQTPIPQGVEYSRDLLVDSVREYLRDVGPPVHVAGFSMGGHTSLALAQEYPELFASLTLVGVSVREHAGLEGWRYKFDPDDLEARYPLWARMLSRIHAPLGGPDAWREVALRDSRSMRIDVDLEALRRLDAPILLVRGDRDPAVDPAQYAALRAVWPQADELVVPAGAHDVQLTRHELVRLPLLDFLERAGADG